MPQRRVAHVQRVLDVPHGEDLEPRVDHRAQGGGEQRQAHLQCVDRIEVAALHGRMAEQQHDDGDANDRTDLADRLVDGTAHRVVLRRQFVDRRGRQRRQHEADAGAAHQEPRQPVQEVRRLMAGDKHEPERGRGIQQRATDQERSVAEASGEATGEHGHWNHRQRAWRDRQPGARLAVVPDVAHVEEHHRESDAEGQRGRIHRAVGPVAEQPQVDERIAGVARPHDKCHERNQTRPDGPDELCASPARRVCFDDGERDRAHGDDEQCHADAVDTSTRAAPIGFAQQGSTPPQRHRADRQVDEEGPRPADVLDDERAQAWPDGGGKAAHRAPQADGHRATALRERRQHDRQRRRGEEGRTHRLQHARGYQPAHGAGEAAQQAMEAAMNSVTPSRNTRFLPCVSARPPAGISIAA